MQISKHHLPSGFTVHNLDKHYTNISMWWSQAVHDNSRCVVSTVLLSDCCGQSFWLNCSVHQISHMRYSLSDPTGQPNGKDVPRTFSRGSPDSGVQLTGSDCHNLGLTFWDRKDRVAEDAENIFSVTISCA